VELYQFSPYVPSWPCTGTASLRLASCLSFETASLWLLSDTDFGYDTVFSKYYSMFKYLLPQFCEIAADSLLYVFRSMMDKRRSVGLVRLNSSYLSHVKSA
jgi:hypothetical protein